MNDFHYDVCYKNKESYFKNMWYSNFYKLDKMLLGRTYRFDNLEDVN